MRIWRSSQRGQRRTTPSLPPQLLWYGLLVLGLGIRVSIRVGDSGLAVDQGGDGARPKASRTAVRISGSPAHVSGKLKSNSCVEHLG